MAVKKKTWNYELARQRLRELGRTREWLGHECRLQPSSLKNILSGHGMPGPQTLLLLSRALEIPEEQLLHCSEEAS